jgi:hypothetical protein
MMSIGKVFIGTVFILLLAGCTQAITDSPKTLATLPDANTVGVVVSLPDTIRVATTGMTVFSNDLVFAEVPDWHLSDVAFNAANTALKSRYQVIRPKFNGLFVDYDTRLNLMTSSKTAVETELEKRIDKSTPVDLYVVLCLSNTAAPYTQRPNIMLDIGISHDRPPFSKTAPVFHTFAMLTIIDGRTFKTVARMPLRYSRKNDSADDLPVQSLPIDFPDNWAQLTPEQKQYAGTQISQLLTDAIGYSLRRLHVAP